MIHQANPEIFAFKLKKGHFEENGDEVWDPKFLIFCMYCIRKFALKPFLNEYSGSFFMNSMSLHHTSIKYL